MITRRLFAGMLPGAAVSAPGVLKAAAESMSVPIPSSPEVSYFAGETAIQTGTKPIAPKMTHEAALDAIKKLPWIKDKLRDYYRKEVKVTTIDYDILIKRSWSDMYKVTVQHERELDKIVNRVMEGNTYKVTSNPFHEILHKMMWG